MKQLPNGSVGVATCPCIADRNVKLDDTRREKAARNLHSPCMQTRLGWFFEEFLLWVS